MLDTSAQNLACIKACQLEEGLPDVCYVYDGSLEGMFSAIFQSFTSKDCVTDITESGIIQPHLGQSITHITTSEEQAQRLQNFLLRAGGRQAYSRVLYASLSDDPHKAWAIRECVRFATTLPALQHCSQCSRRHTCLSLQKCPHATSKGRNSQTAGLEKHLENYAHPQCGAVAQLSRHVANERHHMKQFLRFEHVESDLWFAQCNPNANVVPLLMSFFAARFTNQRFLIYDEAHKLAGVYDGAHSLLVPADNIQKPPTRCADELLMRKAWKTFYHAATIEARYHPELRTAFMPKRLWKNILEVNEPRDYEIRSGTTSLPPIPLPATEDSLSMTPVKSNEGIKLSESVSPSCQK